MGSCVVWAPQYGFGRGQDWGRIGWSVRVGIGWRSDVHVSMRGCMDVCVCALVCVRVLTHARARAHAHACVCCVWQR